MSDRDERQTGRNDDDGGALIFTDLEEAFFQVWLTAGRRGFSCGECARWIGCTGPNLQAIGEELLARPAVVDGLRNQLAREGRARVVWEEALIAAGVFRRGEFERWGIGPAYQSLGYCVDEDRAETEGAPSGTVGHSIGNAVRPSSEGFLRTDQATTPGAGGVTGETRW